MAVYGAVFGQKKFEGTKSCRQVLQKLETPLQQLCNRLATRTVRGHLPLTLKLPSACKSRLTRSQVSSVLDDLDCATAVTTVPMMSLSQQLRAVFVLLVLVCIHSGKGARVALPS